MVRHWRSTFERSLDFDGVSTRAEYWSFTLLYFIILVLTMTVDQIMNTDFVLETHMRLFEFLVIFTLFLTSLSVSVRRLHDIGFSGWWILLGLIPFGILIVVFFMLMKPKLENNKYRKIDYDAQEIVTTE